jgi:hypothetical protein
MKPTAAVTGHDRVKRALLFEVDALRDKLRRIVTACDGPGAAEHILTIVRELARCR